MITFSWHDASREWRIEQRRDGRPLVAAWPAIYLRLDRGRPELVVPQVGEQ